MTAFSVTVSDIMQTSRRTLEPTQNTSTCLPYTHRPNIFTQITKYSLAKLPYHPTLSLQLQKDASLFDLGAENNISFCTGGLGSFIYNTWLETLPPGLESQNFDNDVETYADMRVWDPTTEARTWPVTQSIFGTHTATIGPFWGNEIHQDPPILRVGQNWTSTN